MKLDPGEHRNLAVDYLGMAKDPAKGIGYQQLYATIASAHAALAGPEAEDVAPPLSEAISTIRAESVLPSLRVYGTSTIAEWEWRARTVTDPEIIVSMGAMREYLHQALAEIDRLRELLGDRNG